jgi:mono/diheme cytochrome c family protein
MSRWLKIAGVAVVVILVLLAGAITMTIGWRPILGPAVRPTTDRVFASTPERMERGKYLVEGVNGCLGCHSDPDPTDPGRPLPGREGAGRPWTAEGSPWLVAPNLTPDRETGTGAWSDDTLARAIREGIGHDGRALFPIMPYQRYKAMSDDDLAAIIVYIRSLKPVHNPLPRTQIEFPVNRLINSAPQPVTAPVPPPDMSTPVKRGEYLVTLGACADCHSPMDPHGMPIAGLEFAGGFPLQDAHDKAHSANLTPDPSGIPYYDEALFLEAMRTGKVKARAIKTIMPWAYYRKMTDDDLKAVFAYLRTLKPVKHSVDNSLPPTKCRLCGYEHGAGDRN